MKGKRTGKRPHWKARSPGGVEYLDLGAGALMLPYFYSVEEIDRFIECVAGRGDVSLLVETAAAAVRLPRIVRLAGVHDIHIGLNDLHHLLGLSSHFELLQSRFMRHLTDELRETEHSFGFGGIGRLDDESLPVSADLVYAQYAYQGARSVLVSRVFTARRAPRILRKRFSGLVNGWSTGFSVI